MNDADLPAFPQSAEQYGGLTERDYFAGRALQGLLADCESWGLDHTEIVTNAVGFADRLIAELANAEASVRLIAAAPELLDALESIRIYASDTLSGRADGGPDDRAWQRAAVVEIRKRALAAIAKATQP